MDWLAPSSEHVRKRRCKFKLRTNKDSRAHDTKIGMTAPRRRLNTRRGVPCWRENQIHPHIRPQAAMPRYTFTGNPLPELASFPATPPDSPPKLAVAKSSISNRKRGSLPVITSKFRQYEHKLKKYQSKLTGE